MYFTDYIDTMNMLIFVTSFQEGVQSKSLVLGLV